MDVTFGERVRLLRQRKGLTQNQLARAIKVRRPYLSLIESDQAWEKSVRQIVLLCRALDVSADELLGIAHSPSRNRDSRRG